MKLSSALSILVAVVATASVAEASSVPSVGNHEDKLEHEGKQGRALRRGADAPDVHHQRHTVEVHTKRTSSNPSGHPEHNPKPKTKTTGGVKRHDHGAKPNHKKRTGSITANNYETHIVGGNEATQGEYPEFVHWAVGCGGSLITRDIVLSAAHCDGPEVVGLTAVIGAYDQDAFELKTGPKVREIDDKRVYPDYAATQINDIMLFRLSQPAPANTPVMKLNDKYGVPGKDSSGNPQTMTVIGFGDTTHGGFASDVLMELEIQQVDFDWCNDEDRYDGQVTDSAEFCAGYLKNGVHHGTKDSCQGDSGGPAFVTEGGQRIQVGVVSWGIGCAQQRHPGIYARVSNTYDWIKENACAMTNVPSELCGTAGGGTGDDNTGDDSTGGGTGDDNTGGGTGGGESGTCSSGELLMEFTFTTDEYGDETSWNLSNGGVVIEKVLADTYPNNSPQVINRCLPNDQCYTIRIGDEWGDGMSGSGGQYSVKVDGNLIETKAEYNFGKFTDIQFCGSNTGTGGTDGGSGGGGSGSTCIPVTLKLRTDDYPEQTSFLMYDSQDSNVEYWNKASFIRANTAYPEYTACVPRDKCTYLDLFDSEGDGINGSGFTVTIDGETTQHNTNFGSEVFFNIPEGC